MIILFSIAEHELKHTVLKWPQKFLEKYRGRTASFSSVCMFQVVAFLKTEDLVRNKMSLFGMDTLESGSGL